MEWSTSSFDRQGESQHGNVKVISQAAVVFVDNNHLYTDTAWVSHLGLTQNHSPATQLLGPAATERQNIHMNQLIIQLHFINVKRKKNIKMVL